MDWRRLSTTQHCDAADTSFEITHPFHPLRGQKFQLVTYLHNWGEDRVYFHNAEGRWTSVPASWTTVVPEDPFVAMAQGRCLFRYADLLQLVDLVGRLR
jgi:hypothetical protein